MTQTANRPITKGVLEILPQELDDFEYQVKKFQAGEWDEIEFQAFRLKQGVYGQRQPDSQMVRVKAPFGGVTAEMLDALGVASDRFAPLRKGHVTTRENIQYHHIKLEDTPKMMRVLAEAGMSTREACGNTVRNVTGCPKAGVCADEVFDVTPYAAAYARFFVRHPVTQAMPRKVKSAFSGCEADCAITPIHDMGFVPRIVGGRKGFKMVTGGGTSIMPRIAPVLYDFVPVEEYLKMSEAVFRIFDRTNELRRNKMKARIKFYIDRIGIDEFRKEVEEELKQPWAQRDFDPTGLLFVEDESLDAPTPPVGGYSRNGHVPEFARWVSSNVEPQKQAPYMVATARLPLGDISAEQFHELADLSRKYAGGRARLTHQQNIAFRWVHQEALYEFWQELSRIGFGEPGVDEITDVVSCPGTDSCKLGITSSMGLGRAVSDAIQEMDTSDPLVREMHVKMSGCPNGCGQHHVADIGFHGAAAKAPGGQVPSYELFLGGSYEGGDPRFGLRVRGRVAAKNVPIALGEIIGLYKEQREDGERFKDFVARVGPKTFEPIMTAYRETRELNRESIDTYMDWDKTVIYKMERGEGECAI